MQYSFEFLQYLGYITLKSALVWYIAFGQTYRIQQITPCILDNETIIWAQGLKRCQIHQIEFPDIGISDILPRSFKKTLILSEALVSKNICNKTDLSLTIYCLFEKKLLNNLTIVYFTFKRRNLINCQLDSRSIDS